MSTYQIFSQDVTRNSRGATQEFAVWLTDGHLQYAIDGDIQHGITNINDFLVAAAKVINQGDDNNIGNLEFKGNGSIAENSLENFDGSDRPVFDKNGSAPTISLQDSDTAVRFSGSNIGGSFTVDFGTGTNAEREAEQFKSFAEDLLGKAQATQLESISGNIGGFTRTVKISERVDNIRKVQFKDSGNANDDKWADVYVDFLGAAYGGTKTSDGKISEKNYTAKQLRYANEAKTIVGLGANGVGGKEVWSFSTTEDAMAFHDEVKAAFGFGDRRDIINSAIEDLAESLGGSQSKDGRVSTNYQARQINLTGHDDSSVSLGSHGVGGKEIYDFDNKATALEFIDSVRDLVGVKGQANKLTDDLLFNVTGAGIGNETFVGKDAFVEWLGPEFNGVLTRDGAVSESFDGSSRHGMISGGNFTITLGPSGVGGKEVWTFDNNADALNFATALDTYML